MILMPKNFRMTRVWYWLFILGLIFFSVLYGFISTIINPGQPEGHIASLAFLKVTIIIAMWIIGYERLKTAGVKHTAWAFFTPWIIGTIWIGCISDRPLTLKLEETST